MLYYLVTALYILVCFTMMLVVYLQQGKGGDIASAFGGASSQAAFGARSGATVLSRATWICAAIFIFGALAVGILGKAGPGSVVGGRSPLTPAPRVRRGAAPDGCRHPIPRCRAPGRRSGADP